MRVREARKTHTTQGLPHFPGKKAGVGKWEPGKLEPPSIHSSHTRQ